ncbi:baseplate multidomain protein megatron [Falsigemmobacter faecalis]|uniref:Host specificity protein n=1 Tax=Falsigemmobacter faecalis TaxID=2488730 RepID=A0A3P3DT68_9RHOB|nr:glycoside hydrolase TIM-barrel-like domain-containing protein [Falsigemmobacter faecalis]RRH77311.1 host specificity protein [Falsigemmobacter faecalis]
MATLVLSAAGAAIGSGFGGTVMGLSGAVIGRAAGATLGRMIDTRLAGRGSQLVERGRIERFRLTGAGEGQSMARVWGRVRLGGHVIWASPFEEIVSSEVQRGGKGGGGRGDTRIDSYSYRVSLALGLCEGEILRVGRVWADGEEIGPDRLALRVCTGSEGQMPDPKIEAVEGAGMVPAFRGLAYVVIEDLDLSPFGNRVPQFSFEVVRKAAAGPAGVQDLTRAVAMIPGCGEYALSTTPVHYDYGQGHAVTANVHSPGGRSDLVVSLEQLGGELPECRAVSLVVSWFGSDLRCGLCEIAPKVEQKAVDGAGQPWEAGGQTRAGAALIATKDDRPVYGGTPSDQSVREAIQALRARGQAVMFYPFLLMEQQEGNGLSDPWTGAADQPAMPWRGRITLSVAPGRDGSPDGTEAAEAEVAAFMGNAQPADFTVENGRVLYSGDPADRGYRRFVLHYACLCQAAGGVEAFCIGSELRGLTQIRGAGDSFPMVASLRGLLGELRGILGPECRLSYAADWSEYGGYTAPDGGRYFHLDPLWADENCDFIGIDNYMPLSDWRDGEDHADAAWGSALNPAYLAGNVAGGEGFDWYYASEADALAGRRRPITDGEGEPWIWRYKDLKSWWENRHFDRPGGVRSGEPTPWVPGSKPFWFTELGVAAIDRGGNQPNLFLDPKSSESALPRFSTGRREEAMQTAYLRAMAAHWGDPANNPQASAYPGRMVDMARAFVWAWDARPWPWFPGRSDIWSDGDNHARGHWLNGRASHQPLAAVVAEICTRAGLQADVSRLYQVVQGYVLVQGASGRAALQDLMLAYGFDAVERGGRLVFLPRSGRLSEEIGPDVIALDPESSSGPELTRQPDAELPAEVRLGYLGGEGDFAAASETATRPDRARVGGAYYELPLALTRGEARAVAERWLSEAEVAQDVLRLTLPPSKLHLGPGDVIGFGAAGRFRIDRMEYAGALSVEAVRVDPGVSLPSDFAEPVRRLPTLLPQLPVWGMFLDLPLLRGDEDPQLPHLAVTASPWAGPAGLWESDRDDGYRLSHIALRPATMGVTLTPLPRAASGLWDRGPALRLRLTRGALASESGARVLGGANALAIGDGAPGSWEILQFATAEPMGGGEWEISQRLRGQAGSDARMPEVWPVGSVVVLLTEAVAQPDLSPGLRGLLRHYRLAPLVAGYASPVAGHRIERFEGMGLRPPAPVHLKVRAFAGGRRFSWIRRGRIAADSWEGEIPLGEQREIYEVRILAGEDVLYEARTEGPVFDLSDARVAELGISGPWRFTVAQLSDLAGRGDEAGLAL